MDFMNLAKDIGSSIKELRGLRKCTVRQLADGIDVTEGHIRNIEAGCASPSLETLILIANYLNTSMESILGNYIISKNAISDYRIHEIFDDCSDPETQYLIEVIKIQKDTMRKYSAFKKKES